MKKTLGVILILFGIFIGLYVGLWIMFVGGILDMVEFIKQNFEPRSLLSWAIVKVACASFIGSLSALIFIIPGSSLLELDD